jgi:hypothetical protein
MASRLEWQVVSNELKGIAISGFDLGPQRQVPPRLSLNIAGAQPTRVFPDTNGVRPMTGLIAA